MLDDTVGEAKAQAGRRRLRRSIVSNHSDSSAQFCGRTRREFLWETGGGFTGVALTGLLAADGFFARAARGAPARPFVNPLAPRKPHFDGKAQSVIFLFMYGGPGHVDTFDYKPKLYPL